MFVNRGVEGIPSSSFTSKSRIFLHISFTHFPFLRDPSQLSWIVQGILCTSSCNHLMQVLAYQKGPESKEGERCTSMNFKRELKTLYHAFNSTNNLLQRHLKIFLGNNSIETTPLHNLSNHKSMA